MVGLVEKAPTLNKVLKARQNLAGVAYHTPLDYSRTFSELTGNTVYLKLENMQKTGSFKIRGAYNKILNLTEGERARGVIAASAGNHAQGVACAAARAGIKSTIVMPEGAPISKVMATRGYGAQVVLSGRDYDDAYQQAQALQQETGSVFIHGFDDLEVITGQGTIALELLDDLPDVEAVLVPVGGGGLIAGISFGLKQLKPRTRIIGIQAAGAPAVCLSFQEGRLHESSSTSTFADGIAIRKPGQVTFNLIRHYVDEMLTVTDEEIAGAILMLLERSKIVVEGAGAVGLAALLQRKTGLNGVKTAVVLSGGNIDMNIISIIIERGLVNSGRYVILHTIIDDKPGSLQKLLAVIAETRANVIAVKHDRINPTVPLKQAEVRLTLETKDRDHIKQIRTALAESDYETEIIS
jgi:threonine dehydratase